MPDPTIGTLPLDQLEISTANVRTTPAGKSAFDELKASIAAHGLLENLVARPLGADTQGKPRYAVIAGGRRLAALNELAADGVLAQDHPVPCRVVRNGAADSEISLAENVVRVAMHPADQVEAFGALALAGATAADIAARFGVSERTVEQRLRLGHAAPELLDAYRTDQIDLATLKAFAVTTDTARQLAVWEQVKDQGYRPTGWQIKRMLTEDRLPAGSALARFVGIDAYGAAGGPVLRDLFADEYENGVWFEDPALLTRLALERLQTAADELATRWKWAEARIEANWSDLARFGRVHPTPSRATDEEQAEIDRLHARHDELVNMDEEDWTDELMEEAETIEPRLAEIDAAIKARAVYEPEHMTTAGAIVTVANDGTMQLIPGLVRPEDIPADRSTATTPGQDQAAAGDGTATPSGIEAPRITASSMPPSRTDTEAEARKEAGVGIGLADDLRAIRTALVKSHLATDFAASFDLMVFQMARAVFTPGYHDHALDISVRETSDRPPLRVNDDAFGDWSPGEAMLANRSSLPFDWMEIEDRQQSFAALRALPEADKQSLFAACVARTLNGQLAFEADARPEIEATVARLDIEFAGHVRPTADMFWSRVRKDRMLDVAREVLGAEWAHAHRKDKKAILATAMETAFAKSEARPLGVNKDGYAAALAWAPPGFDAFDAGRVDDEDDGDNAAASAEDTPATTAPAPDEPSTGDVRSGDQPDPAAAEPDAPANGDASPPATADTEAHASLPADPAAPAPAESPENAEPDVRTPRVQDAIDAMNQVPTADGGPRVIISTVGFESEPATQAGAESDTPPPPPVNGAATAATAEALDVPAFLRRS